MTRRIFGLLVAMVTTLALVAPSATAQDGTSPSRTSDGAPTAHLRLEITTSSAWAIVRTDQGWILESEVGTVDNASVSNNYSAVRVDRRDADRPATATVELLFDTTQTDLHLANTEPVVVRLAKSGGGGTATATVTNLNDQAAPVQVASLHHPGPGSTPEQVSHVPAATFFTTHEITLPRATDTTRMIAGYYPWFSDSGDPRLTSYDGPTLSDRPLQRRDLDVASDVASDVRLAARSGVDGFSVAFASTHREEFALVAEAARKAPRPFVVSGALSARLAAKTVNPAGTMLQWMRDLHAEAEAAGDTYLRTDDGRPVAWVWGTNAFTPEQWSWFLAETREQGLDFALIQDAAPERYQHLFAGHYRYGLLDQDTETFSWWWARDAAYLRGGSLLDGSTPPILVTTVSPGHDDCALRDPCTVVERDGVERYNDTWRRALAVRPDIVLVTSWNEWFESTNIAPSERFGSSALQATWEWSLIMDPIRPQRVTIPRRGR